MNKKIKIIILGFGSIGQRHYRNLIKLGFEEVYVYDTKKIPKVHRYLAAEFRLKLKVVEDIKPSTLKKFDVAFICTPNHLHIKNALQCAKAGCCLFIEKPLSHNLRGIKKLLRVCREKKLINMVACNMRFHPCLKFIKNYLAKEKLGKVYAIEHECGYYLPYWRSGRDYRKNYAAKRATGGGVILDDIHEFDLLFWLNNFQPVKESKFIFDKVSHLEIETEDICLAAFKFKNKVLGQVRCDYLQQVYSRTSKVVGEKGNLEWDFKENIVWLRTKTTDKKLLAIKNYDANNMYLEELEYFFSCFQKHQATFNDIERSYNVLKHLALPKKSL